MHLPPIIPYTGGRWYKKIDYAIFNALREEWQISGVKELSKELLGKNYMWLRVAKDEVTKKIVFLCLYVKVVVVEDRIVFEHSEGRLKFMTKDGFGSDWFLL